jgi:pimeloyl-ACP methyl ester carboxylesterase
MLRPMLLAAGLGLVAATAPARASQEFTGELASGAWYHVDIPDGWQPGDALVLYQHGLDFTTPSNPPGLGPLKSVMLAEGYAIAATSYRTRGWALFSAIDDNEDVLAKFEDLAGGAPGEVVPFGGSMGGLIALKLAEADGFPPVKGAYALCPAASGARIWDAAIDLRLAYDVVCNDAGEFPQGSEPYPWAFDLWQIPDGLGDLFDYARLIPVLAPLEQCTGVNLPPALRNDAMQERLDRLQDFAHVSNEDFFVTNIAYATYVMSDLVRAPEKLDDRNPFTTAGVDYSSDPDIEANILRLVADPDAAADLHAASDFTGRIGDAKIVSMHTSKDQLVIPGNEDFVRDAAPADQRTIAIVDETSPTHCGFTDAEGIAGWEALRAWKDGGSQPGVADLQQECLTAVGQGVQGPCRFDPDATIVPFDDIVRPRPGGGTTTLGHSTHERPLHPPPQGRSPASEHHQATAQS